MDPGDSTAIKMNMIKDAMFDQLGFEDFIVKGKIAEIMEEDYYPTVEEEAQIGKEAELIAHSPYQFPHKEKFDWENSFMRSIRDDEIIAAGPAAFERMSGMPALSEDLTGIPRQYMPKVAVLRTEEEALPWLLGQQNLSAQEKARVKGLITGLGADLFADRERAYEDLRGIGSGTFGALNDMIKNKGANSEARFRSRRLIEDITNDAAQGYVKENSLKALKSLEEANILLDNENPTAEDARDYIYLVSGNDPDLMTGITRALIEPETITASTYINAMTLGGFLNPETKTGSWTKITVKLIS